MLANILKLSITEKPNKSDTFLEDLDIWSNFLSCHNVFKWCLLQLSQISGPGNIQISAKAQPDQNNCTMLSSSREPSLNILTYIMYTADDFGIMLANILKLSITENKI